VALTPRGEEWQQLGIIATQIGRYDLARQAFHQAGARSDEVSMGLMYVALRYHRADPAAALELIEPWLAGDGQSLDDLYQAQRILLAAGRVEQAASIAQRYLARSTDAAGRILLHVRQLCGEGRTAEAEAYADSLGVAPTGDPGEDAIVRWHILSYLGRPAEAAEELRRYLHVLRPTPLPEPERAAPAQRRPAGRTAPHPVPVSVAVD
jgi:tetratricopeptide (TPR) repeat protein